MKIIKVLLIINQNNLDELDKFNDNRLFGGKCIFLGRYVKRLLNFRDYAERSDPLSSSIGRYGIGFLPFETTTDEEFHTSRTKTVPGFKNLDDIPRTVIGSSRNQ